MTPSRLALMLSFWLGLEACALGHHAATDGGPEADSPVDVVRIDGADVARPDVFDVAPDTTDVPIVPDAQDVALDDGAMDVPIDLPIDVPIDVPIDLPPACTAPRMMCGANCVDTSTDLASCGACNRACSFPGATAMCVGGTCTFGACSAGRFDCDGMTANGCEAAAACTYPSCNALPSGSTSGVYSIISGGSTFSAWCDMQGDGGGWTLVLKADGTQSTFAFANAIWTDMNPLNAANPSLAMSEAKYPAYWLLPMTQVRVVMVDPRDTMRRSLVIPGANTSLRAQLAGATVPTTLGVAAWRGLLGTSSLQPNCNREGFNAVGDDTVTSSRIRIGIVANEGTDVCASPNSRIGVGGAGSSSSGCAPTTQDANSVGNTAACGADMGDLDVRAFAYVFVR